MANGSVIVRKSYTSFPIRILRGRMNGDGEECKDCVDVEDSGTHTSIYINDRERKMVSCL